MLWSEIDAYAGQTTFDEKFFPDVHILDTERDVDIFVASRLIGEVLEQPDLGMTLPTGSTQIGVYEALVAKQKEQGVDFSRATAYNLDENWPLSHKHPQSYFAYMHTHFLDHVAVGEWHIPNGEAEDPEAEAIRYEQVMLDGQPVRIANLGLGPKKTGHIGFDESGTPINSRAHYVPKLADDTIVANRQLYERPDEMPVGAITQGVGDIFRADEIQMVVKGGHKAEGVREMLFGPVTTEFPASLLRIHPKVTVVMDRAAAKLLPR